MDDRAVSRVSRTALVAAGLLALTSVGASLWRSQTPPVVAADPASPADPAAAIATLEASVKASPEAAGEWTQLAAAYYASGRFREAAGAFERVATLDPATPGVWSAIGEALVLGGKSDQKMPPDARAAFDKAIARDPRDPRARYFLAVARDMDGDHKGAIDDWFALLKDSPPGAPWTEEVRRLITTVAGKHRIDVAARLAAFAPQPAGQQNAMIAGMVEGLATKLKANPANVEGWHADAQPRATGPADCRKDRAARRARHQSGRRRTVERRGSRTGVVNSS